jgi:hypothetical protein
MKTAELFQWVELLKDVPETDFHQGDQGVIVELLEPNENEPETGYLLEIFQDGETLDVIAVPASWTKLLKSTIAEPVTISPDTMDGTLFSQELKYRFKLCWAISKLAKILIVSLKNFPMFRRIVKLLDLLIASVLQKN